jgi:hypothetical protein
MKATELRIGNWVENESTNRQVEGVQLTGGYNEVMFWKIMAFEHDISPIPLTEDWLLKFGFVEVGDRYYDWIKGEIGFANDIPDASYDLVSYDFHDCKIKYVHELQNLHFALTGKEI